jgi:hydroxyacylglutathione hydrolase
MNQIDPHKTYHIHCAGGYRSVIAASILKARGFHKIIDIAGGFAALKKTDLPLSEFVCPSTL